MRFTNIFEFNKIIITIVIIIIINIFVVITLRDEF